MIICKLTNKRVAIVRKFNTEIQYKFGFISFFKSKNQRSRSPNKNGGDNPDGREDNKKKSTAPDTTFKSAGNC